MTVTAPDTRSEKRKALDEAIAAEPMLAAPDLPASAKGGPMEAFLPPKRKPLAIAGIVENGMIRLLDPMQTLPEHSKVIVVAAV